MKLKDKIECTLERHVKLKENQSENIEKIVEDFAIGFTEWIIRTRTYNAGLDAKHLLKMYKNQKGL